MVAALVGPMQVSCTSCRAVAGRPCVDARGYLYNGGGSHARRREDWLAAEERELEQLRATEPA